MPLFAFLRTCINRETQMYWWPNASYSSATRNRQIKIEQFKLYLVFVQFELHLNTENMFKANTQLKTHFRGFKYHTVIIYKVRLRWTLKKKRADSFSWSEKSRIINGREYVWMFPFWVASIRWNKQQCPHLQAGSHLLQFSSSLPSGQSSKPLHRKRPMMQWIPLAQGKNVAPHLDLAFAVRRDKWAEVRETICNG